MRNRSVMTHQFSQIPRATIPRSTFDRSHGHKTTFNAGLLIPILVDEALPGDTFNCRMTAFARMATPIKPLMDNLFLETFFFAVPNRLVWENWEKFNGQQDNPGDSIDYTIPVQTVAGGHGENSLADYFGIPLGVDPSVYNQLPFRAYNLIWNEWFRDQNLQDSLPVPTGDTGNAIVAVQRRGKRHDYFTSALPWPQKGDTVNLPLGTTAPVAFQAGTTTGQAHAYPELGQTGPNNFRSIRTTSPTAAVDTSALGPGAQGPLVADLSSATAATINELRQAFQIQRLQERDARGGTRYTEIIRAHFGVISPDQRLQRPEFLGGGSTMININPVMQTSETASGSQTPQGNLAAYGTASVSNHGFTKSFTEHCYIIGLMNVRADLTYQQGLERMWNRRTRYDFYWPALSNIGEQAILNKEIFYQGAAADEEVFGYQERYAEYRYKPSRISGKFRSKANNPLDVWHLSQNFASLPVLNSSFIIDNPPVDRVIAVETEPHFLCDMHFSMKCARPMPLYGVPGLIDHF